MNVLVYEPIVSVGNLIINSLIPLGMKVKVVTDSSLIIFSLKSAGFDILVMDSSEDRQAMGTIVGDIKRNPLYSSVKVLLHEEITDKKYLLNMIKIGISGFIQKPFNPNNFVSNLSGFIKKFNLEKNGKRVHIRITPKPTDKISAIARSVVTFKIVNMQVMNISMGGVLLKAPVGEDSLTFKVKQVIKNLQIKIGLKAFEVTSVIVGVKDNLIAFKFSKLSGESVDILSRYIYDNLSYDDTSTLSGDDLVPVSDDSLRKNISIDLSENNKENDVLKIINKGRSND